jgi:arylsulfatase A-like enzyme
MEIGVGYPGYNTLIPQSKRGLGDILKLNGYNTSWYGKNHNVPDWHTSQAGPFDLWPIGLGFEYFYGFIGGDTSQWAPAIVENTRPIEPPHDDPDYNFDEDMADKAIAWIQMQKAVAPDKPFLAYFATGTAHAPHHAPKDWIAKFKGKFDHGWDRQREMTHQKQLEMGIIPPGTKLTTRHESIEAWDSLSAQQKEVFAHRMEVYAGALSHADHEIGRVVDAVEVLGELDNTLVIYIQGDNGASAEGSPQGLLNEMSFFNNIPEEFSEVYRRMDELGGPLTFNHYPVGWAHAMDTPFQWTKQVASHFGGTRNGLVIAWPDRIKDAGGIRQQFHHVIDILPTVLEATGLPAPKSVYGTEQAPIEGVSMVYSWDDANAPTKHKTQYFEMFANRAIYHDGWIATTTPIDPPWASVPTPGIDPVDDFDWELYHVANDFSESENLAAENPGKLAELQGLFMSEAEKYNVLPLDNSKVERLDVSNRPSNTEGRNEFTYYEGMIRIPEGAATDIKNKSFAISAALEIPSGGAEGVVMTQGGRFSGVGLYLLEGRPVFHYNLCGVDRVTVAGKQSLTPGEHVVIADFNYDGGVGAGGVLTLSVDGKEVASERLERTIGYRVSLDETLDIGEDTGTPVSEDYHVPFKFTGEIAKVTINITEQELTEEQLKKYREMRARAMTH